MRRLLPRLRPWHIVVLAVIASGAAAAWVSGESRAAAGDASGARRLRLLAPVLLVALTVVSLLQLRWGWIALALLGLNLAAGALLRRAPWPQGNPPVPEPPPVERRRWRLGDPIETLWGIAAGGLAAGFSGAGAVIAYMLAMDRLVSTWLPSLSDRTSMVAGFFWILIQFALCGAVAGGVIGSRRPRLGAREIAAALAGIMAAFFALHAASTLVVDVPAFQQVRILEDAGAPLFLARFVLWLLRMLAAVLAGLACAALAGPSEAPRPHARVALAAFLSTLLAPWAAALYAGRLSYDAVLAGILFERSGRLEAPRRLYTLGLQQHPDDKASSYLQFRLATVYHRLRRDDDSKALLKQLVARHDKAKKLVELAEQYLQAWDRAPQGARRVTLPGIETSTEFKAGYCMPNSLSLVLRFWRVTDSAKLIGSRITGMDVGTSIQDAVWYTQDRGLRHFLLPLASVADVKGFIDEGLPVLIYIPQHVLAVIGYDEAWDSLVTYDVAQEEIWVDHPVAKLLPEWKTEKSVVSVVMSDERFAALPAERRRRLEASTVAHLHYLLHHAFHQSSDERSKETALAHLEASVAADPSQFYVMAHIFARDQWGETPRRRLEEGYPIKEVIRDGFAFARRDFDNDEALTELSQSALDLGLRDELEGFLYSRRRDGTLSAHDGLVSLLGRLQLSEGKTREATATLGGEDLEPLRQWALADAQEKSGARSAAQETYRSIVRGGGDGEGWEESDRLGPEGRSVPEWMRRFMPPREEAAPRDLLLRRTALARMTALSAGSDAEQPDIDAVASYCRDFPWDSGAQSRYVELLSRRIGSGSLTPSLRQTALTRLNQSARLARLFAPDSEEGARAADIARRLDADSTASR